MSQKFLNYLPIDNLPYKVNKQRITKHPFKYSCPFCGKKYTSRSGLLSHKNRVHFQRKPYRCETCNEHFFTSAGRVAHIRKEHDASMLGSFNGSTIESDATNAPETEIDHQLDKDNQIFSNPIDSWIGLDDQSSEVSDDPEIEISSDESQYSDDNEDDLIAPISHDHSSINNDKNSTFPEKELTCLECNISFLDSNKFIQHIESHKNISDKEIDEKEKQVIECFFCNRTFPTQEWNKIHLKYHHPKLYKKYIKYNGFKCKFCGELYNNYKSKKLHQELYCTMVLR